MSDLTTDVAIVGGGVFGCAIAYELASRGVDVTIVERGPIGREASWASAGIISLPSRDDMALERVEITRRSRARYPQLVAELEAETGLLMDYRRPGYIYVAVDEPHAAWVNRHGDWLQGLGLEVNRLDPATARELDPALPEQLLAAWFAPDVGALSLHRLTQALAIAAANRGARVLIDSPVIAVNQTAGRVTGVELPTGTLQAGTVVLATGAWTQLLGAALGIRLPVRPVKGQLITFGNPPRTPRHIFSGHGGYIVPRVDGSILAAATEEEAGYDRRVTGEGLSWLLNLASTLCPGLPEGEVLATWTGLRPGNPDGEPLMGPVDGFEGLWVVAGHFRTGAKEAPGSAELVAEAIVSGGIDPLLKRFLPRPERWAGEASNPL